MLFGLSSLPVFLLLAIAAVEAVAACVEVNVLVLWKPPTLKVSGQTEYKTSTPRASDTGDAVASRSDNGGSSEAKPERATGRASLTKYSDFQRRETIRGI